MELKVYNFSELPTKARNKAIEIELNNVREDFDNLYTDEIISDFKEKLESIGFEDAKCFYSYSFSQGDGACFDANVNFEKVCNHLGLTVESDWNVDCSIVKNSFANYYSHELTRYISLEINDVTDDILNDYAKAIEELRISLCKELYNKIDAQYQAIVNEETAIENIEANDYKYVIKSEITNAIIL